MLSCAHFLTTGNVVQFTLRRLLCQKRLSWEETELKNKADERAAGAVCSKDVEKHDEMSDV